MSNQSFSSTIAHRDAPGRLTGNMSGAQQYRIVAALIASERGRTVVDSESIFDQLQPETVRRIVQAAYRRLPLMSIRL